MSIKTCFRCHKKENLNKLYDFSICNTCKQELTLMTNETIKKHLQNNPSFKKEAQSKLDILETEYARKKIKLLHILEKIESFKT